jgi:hypothetical protein
MKSIKTLGLAAFAVLMAMAFLGASSAMAGSTQLCMNDEDPCGSVIEHVHEQTSKGAPARLLSSLGNVTCDALFLGSTLGLGAPLVIHGNFTYTNCLRNGEACTVTEVSTSSLIEVLRTAAETAKLTGEGEVNVQCGINCTYNGEELSGTSKGALLAGGTGESSTSEAVVHHVGGAICPETSRLDIRMTPLIKTYIASEPPKVSESTQLCKTDESPCEAANVISHVHEQTAAGAPATLLSSLGNVTCDALFLGLTLGLGAPLVIHGNFTYTNCLRNGKSCTVTEVSTSSLLSVLKTSHETASVTGEGEVNVHCGIFINCTYNGEGLEATAKGPLLSTAANGEVTLNKQVTHHVGGGICPETGKLDIETHPSIKTYIASESTEVSESTQLCKADESPCEAANAIAHVHEETSKGAPATLLSSLGNVTCDALFLGSTLELGAPLVIHGNFTYTNCLRNGEACTVTEVSTSSLIEVLRTAAEEATITGEGEVNVQCGINCTYNGEELSGTAKGALAAGGTGESSTTEATTHHVGGAICPETSKLDIRLTPLLATYIVT